MSRLMRWHANNESEDQVMRGPADSGQWKFANNRWRFLKEEPRHVRLGMAMDGVNPYGNNSSSHSTWPIVLVNYNLPPWMSIKAVHIMLCAIVPGTNSKCFIIVSFWKVKHSFVKLFLQFYFYSSCSFTSIRNVYKNLVSYVCIVRKVVF
jgi:hypothetical protein